MLLTVASAALKRNAAASTVRQALIEDFATVLGVSVGSITHIDITAGAIGTDDTSIAVVISTTDPGTVDARFRRQVATGHPALAWMVNTRRVLRLGESDMTLLSAAAEQSAPLTASPPSPPAAAASEGFCASVGKCAGIGAGGAAFIALVGIVLWRRGKQSPGADVGSGGRRSAMSSANADPRRTGIHFHFESNRTGGADENVGLEELLDYDPEEATAILRRENVVGQQAQLSDSLL